jgi:hypothetical protein
LVGVLVAGGEVGVLVDAGAEVGVGVLVAADGDVGVGVLVAADGLVGVGVLVAALVGLLERVGVGVAVGPVLVGLGV